MKVDYVREHVEPIPNPIKTVVLTLSLKEFHDLSVVASIDEVVMHDAIMNGIPVGDKRRTYSVYKLLERIKLEAAEKGLPHYGVLLGDK